MSITYYRFRKCIVTFIIKVGFIDITSPEKSISLELIEEEKIEPKHLGTYSRKAQTIYQELVNQQFKHIIQYGTNFLNSGIIYKTTGKIWKVKL
ncbi:hypothetical protein EJB10_01385 [Wolbachia endosymbiont of Brugia malayi]|uniref:hypothetical protein n=1 Tax=Wolbachia endosymbiont of Brugia malayi TaxID=80849 RepID=UPI00004C94D4|nr:hypothetical protein [Wolbachia endosymbiont of Brugia malayi]AAW71301.1 Predicted protein WF-4 [Wolbachia endosymbiont strain TRS of Brugia malayi]QCB61492.1 hypothetical protein EJB10_01385 [Wolbachia endosymbiont of Brugia malayi]